MGLETTCFIIYSGNYLNGLIELVNDCYFPFNQQELYPIKPLPSLPHNVQLVTLDEQLVLCNRLYQNYLRRQSLFPDNSVAVYISLQGEICNFQLSTTCLKSFNLFIILFPFDLVSGCSVDPALQILLLAVRCG